MRLSRWLCVLGIAALALLTLPATPAFARRPCGFWYRDYATVWYWPASNFQPSMPAPGAARISYYSSNGQPLGIRAVQRDETRREVLPLSEMGNQNFPDQRH